MASRAWHMICIELFYLQADIAKAKRHTPGHSAGCSVRLVPCNK